MPNLLPETYIHRDNKHLVRQLIFKEIYVNYLKYKAIVGLGGPDINSYCEQLYKVGIKKIEIWENDQATAKKQARMVKYPVRMRFGDVLAATPNKVNTLYDLDFTITVKNLHQHIAKFKDNFIMTFSGRLKGGIERIIYEFFFVRNESIYSIVERHKDGIPYKSITTTRGRYMFITYYDTTPMCCIAKIK